MYNVYIDSGTTHTRIFLTQGDEWLDTQHVAVGTRDSALRGSNDILLSGMKSGYDMLLSRNQLCDHEIVSLWASGMVTNTFGLAEVDHLSVPVHAETLVSKLYPHFEGKYFHRMINLVRGVKTAQTAQQIDLENISSINNVRGEEIEAIGVVASGIIPAGCDCAIILPGSHTHICHMTDGVITDILSCLTGELNHAVRQETILGGELSADPGEMLETHVLRGLHLLQEFGLCRALYIVHDTRVFGIGDDQIRTQMLEGIIAGSVIEPLIRKLKSDWQGVQRIIIAGDKPYVKAYEMICRHLLPDIITEIPHSENPVNYALCGFFELLRLANRQGELRTEK